MGEGSCGEGGGSERGGLRGRSFDEGGRTMLGSGRETPGSERTWLHYSLQSINEINLAGSVPSSPS